jgi:hypothetical protein
MPGQVSSLFALFSLTAARGLGGALSHARQTVLLPNFNRLHVIADSPLRQFLFYQLEHKKKFYPTRRDEAAVNPDGSLLR